MREFRFNYAANPYRIKGILSAPAALEHAQDARCLMDRKIFLVEDDADIAHLVQHHLRTAGFRVRWFAGAAQVIAEAEQAPPSLFLLDIMVPDGDGLELCRRIRNSARLAQVPVIFLTAKSGESDRVVGFELGADDYVTKPFSPRELIARIKAVLRRFDPPLSTIPIRAKDLEIHPDSMTVLKQGTPVSMTATEFRLLEYMARHAGRVFTRDQLLDAVWQDTRFVTPRSVDVYVRRVREKIEPNPEEPEYVRTVRGAGYRFEVPR
jgi:DNA-binding response OmpR family regulator